MKYMVKTSIINVIGKIWMPAITCAQTYTLSKYDIENITNDEGKIDRDSVEYWLCTHAGDFQSIEDFFADIELPDNKNIIIPWKSEESELTYNDCMYPPLENEL